MGLVNKARKRLRKSAGNFWRWAKSPKKPATRARRWKAGWKVAKKKAKRTGKKIWDQRRRVYRKRYKQQERRAKPQPAPKSISARPGHPHWGGSDDILSNEVDPIARKRGLHPNSAKRTDCYGNCASDHHTSQSYASARDYPTANNHALKNRIALQVVGRSVADYEDVYFRRAGRTYRFQAIAGTHGTGPHLHIGIRRA